MILQDFKTRQIWWFLPLILAVGGVVINWNQLQVENVLFGLAFLVLLILVLYAYILIRYKSTKLFAEYFGIGDLLILIALVPFFEFRHFVFFFTLATLFSVLGHLLMNWFKKQESIPYAGYLSIFLLVHLLAVRLLDLNIFLTLDA